MDKIPKPAEPAKPAKPTFILVGAERAGSTSLYHALRQHPEIFMPRVKEPTYFTSRYWCSGLTRADYLALFEGGRGYPAIGEASTAYLYSEESAEWIRRELGAVKILITLRNPVDRAVSLYNFMFVQGFEGSSSFAQALEREDARFANPDGLPFPYLPDYLYYRTGLYSQQVERYLNIFGSPAVKITLFEEFVRDPLEICRDYYDFLGVAPDFQPDLERPEHGAGLRSVALEYWIRNRSPLFFRYIPRGMGRRLARAARLLNHSPGAFRSPPPSLRAELLDRFMPDIRRLEGLIGRDLSVWYRATEPTGREREPIEGIIFRG